MKSEKRFKVGINSNNGVGLFDDSATLFFIKFINKEDAVSCKNSLMYYCNLMNELYEENEQLKEEKKLFDALEHNWNILYNEAKDKVEELARENEQLKKEHKIAIDEMITDYKNLEKENEQLKNYFKKRAECSNFQINKLKEEIEELKRERDDWKSSTCSYMNKDSILSMDCQIVHEALWELEKEIEFGSKREDLFFDLKEKFEKLNNHRIGVFDDE